MTKIWKLSMHYGATLGALLLATGVYAQQRTFNLPEQDATRSIPEFARQAGIQISAPTAGLKGMRTPSVHGDMDVRAALKQLLAGTGLTVVSDEGGMVVLGKSKVGDVRGAVFEESPDPSHHLARVETESSERMQITAGAAKGKDRGKDSKATAGKSNEDGLVVTGTRIRGTTDIASPSLIITREDIERAGFQTVEQLFESLPQNFTGAHPAAGLGAGSGSTNASSFAEDAATTGATGLDLRGLGPDSTLVLVNGKRRAAGSSGARFVDISTIPLSAVERVEIVSGAGSTLYGSDAVAGTVNFIMRRDFSGAQSRIAYGAPTDYSDGQRLQANHFWARDFGRGSLVVTYDYRRERPSNFVDLGLFPAEETSSGATYDYLPFQSDLKQHSATASGRFALNRRLEFYADLLFTDKELERTTRFTYTAPRYAGAGETHNAMTMATREHSASAGFEFDLSRGWSVDLSALHSLSQTPSHSDQFTDRGPNDHTVSLFDSDRHARVSSLSVVADGPLFSIGGVTPKMALGFETREEQYVNSYVGSITYIGSFSGVFPINTHSRFDRTLDSAFGELRAPLIANGPPGVERLELILGARQDSYDDVGDASTWQSGLIWQVLEDLAVRGTYAKSFRAPSFRDTVSGGSAALNQLPDPLAGIGATSPVLSLAGTAPVGPEEGKSWSVSLDYAPDFAQWAKLSLSWLSVDYENRIATPMTYFEFQAALQTEARYATLIARNPDLAEVEAFFSQDSDGEIGSPWLLPTWDPTTGAAGLLAQAPGLILVDQRTQNLSVDVYEGIDLRFDTNFDTQVGQLNFGLNTTWMRKRGNQVTPTSEYFSTKDVVGRPVGFHLRANAGWTGEGPLGAYVYLNYKPGYDNPFSTPASRVRSWTMVDLTLRFSGSRLTGKSWLRDIDASVAVNNIFAEEPPPVIAGQSSQITYDPANASPVGRYVTLNASKRW